MIVITGGTGGVGSRLATRLAQQGHPVRTISRHRSAHTPDTVEHQLLDLTNPAAHDAALNECTALFVNARAVGPRVHDLLAAARRVDVQHVVVLSASNVDDPLELQPSRERGDRNREVERAVIEAGIPWVSLRPTIFASNTLGTIAPQLQTGATVRAAYAKASFAPIAEDDIAEVAAQALVHLKYRGQHLTLTGPQGLTISDQVAIIGKAVGRSLRFEAIPPEAARTALLAGGFTDGFATAYLRMLDAATHSPTTVTTTVQDITGHKATSFADWAEQHADAFRQ